jgi:Leucine-rich repeat (LRR) protein
MLWILSIVTVIFLSGSFALDCKKRITSDNKQYDVENCDNLNFDLMEIQFSKVQKINAGGKNNTFIKLRNNDFKEFKELTFLHLSDCKIQDITEGAFNGLSKLTQLILRNNRIINLDRNTFKPLNYLKYLCLSSNKITKLDPDLFRKNSKIQTLHLNGNKIERISGELFQPLTNLKELDLSDNQIYSIGRDAFRKLNLPVELILLNNICVSKSFNLNHQSDFDQLNNILEACFNNYQRNISLSFNRETPNESSSSGFVIVFLAVLGHCIVAVILNE